MIKTILSALGRFIYMVLFGTVVTMMASGLSDIYYFFIRLRYTSGLDSLKTWLIAGAIIGVLLGAVATVMALKHTKRPKDFSLIFLVVLRFLIIAVNITVLSLATWNYYKFDYFRLKDAGPIAIEVGIILGLLDLSTRAYNYIKSSES